MAPRSGGDIILILLAVIPHPREAQFVPIPGGMGPSMSFGRETGLVRIEIPDIRRGAMNPPKERFEHYQRPKWRTVIANARVMLIDECRQEIAIEKPRFG